MQDPITRRPLRGGVQSGHAGTYRREGMQMRGAPLQGALRRASRFARPRPHIALAPAARCAALLVADALRRERAPSHVDARAGTGQPPSCVRARASRAAPPSHTQPRPPRGQPPIARHHRIACSCSPRHDVESGSHVPAARALHAAPRCMLRDPAMPVRSVEPSHGGRVGFRTLHLVRHAIAATRCTPRSYNRTNARNGASFL